MTASSRSPSLDPCHNIHARTTHNTSSARVKLYFFKRKAWACLDFSEGDNEQGKPLDHVCGFQYLPDASGASATSTTLVIESSDDDEPSNPAPTAAPSMPPIVSTAAEAGSTGAPPATAAGAAASPCAPRVRAQWRSPPTAAGADSSRRLKVINTPPAKRPRVDAPGAPVRPPYSQRVQSIDSELGASITAAQVPEDDSVSDDSHDGEATGSASANAGQPERFNNNFRGPS
jgi:hypothetical protein